MPPALEAPVVCYVTDRKSLDSSGSNQNLLATIRAAIASGVDWVQIREKDLSARALLRLTRDAIDLLRRGQSRPKAVRIIVNNRLDVALAAGADGVHLGGGSVPAREAIRWLRNGNRPGDFLVGVSCHNLEEARAAEDAGAHYAFFGPVFDSPAKRSFGAPQGVARLEEVCRSLKIPVLAIGGIGPENARECLTARASGIAAIRMFQRAGGAEDTLKMQVGRLHQTR